MKYFIVILLSVLIFGCSNEKKELAEKIKNDPDFPKVQQMALEVVKNGFNAGDGYGEVWIRDYNTFIELSAKIYPKDVLKNNILVFFRLQGDDGNIIDGFVPQSKVVPSEGGYKWIYTDLEPIYCGMKNTVETDQETSLVQTVYKYIKATGDKSILNEKPGDKTVAERMEDAMNFLLNKRWSEKYGLLWGATTADWGDVQQSDPWGVFLDENTKKAIDVYDNAMFLIALDNLIEMLPEKKTKWQSVHDGVAENTMKYLWDEKNKKFIPHLYLDGSPFPPDFDENRIFYHGGTAVAIEAGLLNKEQIKISLDKMLENVKASGAASIGLTLYPPYPEGFFENKGMYPYGYQNGGDWTWFGARMIQQLVKYGFIKEAYENIQSMTERVVKNKGFYEWYTVDNKPEGSGTFKGSAGVLHKAIEMLDEWASRNE